MIEPKYKLTKKLFGNITKIERLYGQIEAMKLPAKLELNLKRDNLIQSTYASNKIEGNPLSLPEVTNLLLDDRIPVNRDEKEVVNYFALLEKLDEYRDRKYDVELLKELHFELFNGIHDYAGKIRNEMVAIGKYTGEQGNVSFKVKHAPPFHNEKEIEQAMKELFDWAAGDEDTPPIIKIGSFHHEFVYLHPFEDGNGRVCRILTALMFIRDGYRINKYFVLDDYYDIDRNQYSDMLHTADNGDKTKWLEYFSDGVMYSLKSALDRAKVSLRRLKVEDRPTNKEREVLEILEKIPQVTSTDIADDLQVSRQQAHSLLKSLVEKGLVERIGSTKSSYYQLK